MEIHHSSNFRRISPIVGPGAYPHPEYADRDRESGRAPVLSHLPKLWVHGLVELAALGISQSWAAREPKR